MKWIAVETPQPGDLATHKSGTLDGRTVTRTDAVGWLVWIDLLGREAGPFPIDNYDYTRRVEDEAAGS